MRIPGWLGHRRLLDPAVLDIEDRRGNTARAVSVLIYKRLVISILIPRHVLTVRRRDHAMTMALILKMHSHIFRW